MRDKRNPAQRHRFFRIAPAFNYATSDERKFSGRMRHALWTLLYHPTTGRPFRVIEELRHYEGVGSFVVAVIATVGMLAVSAALAALTV